MIKGHAIPLALIVSITFAVAQTGAAPLVSARDGLKKTPELATHAQPLGAIQAAEFTSTSTHASHLFPVNDSKGLLLTCTAPEIDTNPDTDVFRDCKLAPGRTLDDVMHTLVGAIHYVQNR